MEHLDRPPESSATDRLDSWKEIASYLRRDVRTVQRWEQKEGLPVHRLPHDKPGSVNAFESELDAWHDRGRKSVDAADPPERIRVIGVTAIVLVAALCVAALWTVRRWPRAEPGAITRAVQLTSTESLELFPSMSADGRWIVYSSGVGDATDVILQAVGADHGTNLTADSPDEGRVVGVALYDFESQKYRQLATARAVGEPELGEHVAWLPDGGHLIGSTRSRLLVLDVSTGSATELLNLEPDVILWPAVPRDGRYLYFGRERIDADVWTSELTPRNR